MTRILLPLSITVASLALGYGQGRQADVIKAGADTAQTAEYRPVDRNTTDIALSNISIGQWDTTLLGWDIHISQLYQGVAYKDTDTCYPNYMRFVDLSKDGKKLFTDYQITSKKLLGKSFHPYLAFTSLSLWYATTSSLYFYTGCCEPETDNCAEFILVFSRDGKMHQYPLLSTLDGCLDGIAIDVSTFYILYATELSQSFPNRSEIKKILDKYCTPAFSEQMAAHTLRNNPAFGVPKFNPQWLNSIEIDTISGSSPICEVSYTRIPGSKKRVVVRLPLQRKTENCYLISGVEEKKR